MTEPELGGNTLFFFFCLNVTLSHSNTHCLNGADFAVMLVGLRRPFGLHNGIGTAGSMTLIAVYDTSKERWICKL